jgi:hypothetical protein
MQASDHDRKLDAASKALEGCVNRELALAAMARDIKELCDKPNEAVLFWLGEERRVAASKTLDAVIAWKAERDIANGSS